MGSSGLARAQPVRGSFPAQVAIAFLLCAVLIQAASIFDLMLPQTTYVAFIVQLLVIGIYSVITYRRGDHVAVIVAALLFGYLYFEHLHFSRISGSAANIKALVIYLPAFTFVPLARGRCSISTALRILAAITIVYLLIYVFTQNYILSEFAGVRGVASAVGDRAARVQLALGFASYVAFYAAVNRRWGGLMRALVFALALYALWLSGSRTFQAIFFVVLLLHIGNALGFSMRLALFLVFLAVAFCLLGAFFVPGFNPFAISSGDESGAARAEEYGYAITLIRIYWLLGIGVPGSADALQEFARTPQYHPLYPTDLGVIGPLLLFGVAGVVIFIVATFLAIVPRWVALRTPELRALHLNCVTCGFYGVISPSLILESHSVFLALIFAAWLREKAFVIGARSRSFYPFFEPGVRPPGRIERFFEWLRR